MTHASLAFLWLLSVFHIYFFKFLKIGVKFLYSVASFCRTAVWTGCMYTCVSSPLSLPPVLHSLFAKGVFSGLIWGRPEVLWKPLAGSGPGPQACSALMVVLRVFLHLAGKLGLWRHTLLSVITSLLTKRPKPKPELLTHWRNRNRLFWPHIKLAPSSSPEVWTFLFKWSWGSRGSIPNFLSLGDYLENGVVKT